MRRALAWIGGAVGAAALLRLLRRRSAGATPLADPTREDPAAELRRKLAEAREAPDDRDDFDAAEGVPVDQAEPSARATAIDERRRAVHERAEAALEEIRGADETPRE